MKRFFFSFLLILLFSGCSFGRSTIHAVENIVHDKTVFIWEKLINFLEDHVDLDESTDVSVVEVPDTVENKEIFRKIIGVELSGDIKNLLVYWELWIDSIYLFSFTAEKHTFEAIIETNNLKQPEVTQWPISKKSIVWWDEEFIKTLPSYHQSDEHSSRIFWYDEKTMKAYYQQILY